MSGKKEIVEIVDEEVVVELHREGEDQTMAVEKVSADAEQPPLIETDVFGTAKPKRAERINDLRSKDIDSSLLEHKRAQKADLEDRWEEVGVRSWNKWVVLGGGLVLLMIAGGVVWAVSRLDDGIEKSAEATVELERKVVAGTKKERSAAKLVEQMEVVCKKYVEAGSVDEMLDLVRDPKRVEPLMRKYYLDNKIVPETFDRIEARIPVEVKRQIFWLVSYRTKETSEAQQLLVGQGDEDTKVDWESRVVYQPNDWDAFVDGRVEEPKLFRVYLEDVNYAAFYGFEFSDYKKYRCYKITLKDRDDYLWGYAKIGTALDKRLLRGFGGVRNKLGNRGLNQTPAVIRIKFPKDSMSDKCVSIEEVVSDSWILFE